MNIRAQRIGKAAMFVILLPLQGCVTHRLQHKLLNQAGSLPNVYYQEVLNNLAMIEADPTRMPYFSDPQTARTGIQQTVSGSNRVDWDLISTGPTGVLTLFDRFLFSREAATVGTSHTENGEWSSVTDNDPDKLFTMRAAYHTVSGHATPEDKEILHEFYYRHYDHAVCPPAAPERR